MSVPDGKKRTAQVLLENPENVALLPGRPCQALSLFYIICGFISVIMKPKAFYTSLKT